MRPLPSLFQGDKTQLCQSFLVGQVAMPFDDLRGPPWDPLQSARVFLEIRGPKLGAALQVQADRR